MKHGLLVMAWIGAALRLHGQSVETGFLNRAVTLDGVEYRYQVFVPRDYKPSAQWPVVLALHGGGQRGSDGLIQTEGGLGLAIRVHQERFPAIVVFPQVHQTAKAGWQAQAAELALATLDKTLGEFNADRSRVYLTGFSMGANGSWYLAYHHPDRFAALAVVCGFVQARTSSDGTFAYAQIAPESDADPYAAVAERVRTLPIWIFHGDADSIVSVESSRRIAEALRHVNANVQYTEFPGVGHESWDLAYDRADLFEWMFQQRSAFAKATADPP
jgi:predicted peptidase